MPMIEIKDPEKYAKALELLILRGGTYHTRPTQRLIVNGRQLEALIGRGIISFDDIVDGNGKKKENSRK